MINPQALLTTEEAAVYIRMNRQTLNKWRHLKIGPSYVKLGRSVFYKVADLDAFVSASSVSAGAK